MSTPSRDLCRRVVEVACLAPSVRNSQPWRWRIVGTSSDRAVGRPHPSAGPGEADGRNLAISCGAALHHGIVAAHALGLTSERHPGARRSEPDLLARIELSPGHPPADALETLDLIGQRRTDRRRFTSWPIPDERLGRLVQAGGGWGAYAVPVVDVATRHRTELLLELAPAREPFRAPRTRCGPGRARGRGTRRPAVPVHGRGRPARLAAGRSGTQRPVAAPPPATASRSSR